MDNYYNNQLENCSIPVEIYDPHTYQIPDPFERASIEKYLHDDGCLAIYPIVYTVIDDTVFIVEGNIRYTYYKKSKTDGTWEHNPPTFLRVDAEHAQKIRKAAFYKKDKSKLQRAIYGAYFYAEAFQQDAEKRQLSGRTVNADDKGTVASKIALLVGCSESYAKSGLMLWRADNEFFYDMIYLRSLYMSSDDVKQFKNLTSEKKQRYIDVMKSHIDDADLNKRKSLFKIAENELYDTLKNTDEKIINDIAGGAQHRESFMNAFNDAKTSSSSKSNVSSHNEQNSNDGNSNEFTYEIPLRCNAQIPDDALDAISNFLESQFQIMCKRMDNRMEMIMDFDMKPYQILMKLNNPHFTSYFLSTDEIFQIIGETA